MTGGLIVFFVLAILVLIIIAKTAIVVPQQSAYVVERLGRFHGILNAGFMCCCRSSTSSATATR